MVNNACDHRIVHSLKSLCSPNLEFITPLLWPFWLPRKFMATTAMAVYISPQVDTDFVLKELYRTISALKNCYSEAALNMVGCFNHVFQRKVLSKYFQHIKVNTWGCTTLNHCYSPFCIACKPLLHPLFSKSDLSSVLFAYRQKPKQPSPILRTIYCWSDESGTVLHDWFDHMNWDMLCVTSDNDLDIYTNSHRGMHRGFRNRGSIATCELPSPWVTLSSPPVITGALVPLITGGQHAKNLQACQCPKGGQSQ